MTPNSPEDPEAGRDCRPPGLPGDADTPRRCQPGTPSGGKPIGEPISLSSEPVFELVESGETLDVIPVVDPITTFCWWCGDPATLNADSLCLLCETRKADRDRRREAERDRRRETAGSDFDYDPRYDSGAEDDDDCWYQRGPTRAARRRDDDLGWSGPLLWIMILYVILMVVSLVWGASLLSQRGELNQDDLLHGTAVVEILDTIIIMVALAIVRRKSLPELSPGVRPIAWGLGMPVLALLVGVNILYAAFLRDAFGSPEVQDILPITMFTVVLVCVQPAIVEELYFRYIAFGALYRAAGLHATVWITGVMFAVMHIYNPLGVPYLVLAGVVFGYARVWGGLALPIAMHFIHNFVVLALEAGK
jgi:membrane protease YdiL (CAAX protease family)